MPRHALAVAFGFADEVAAPERDVRPEDRLDQVEHFVGEEPVEEFRIDKVRHVHRLRPNVGGQAGKLLLEVIF